MLKAQSAYRAHHSCETALIRVINDILLALDKGDEAVLLLLDYSAAFDTVRHNILFTRFSERGICGKALELLKSYFQNRTFSVVIDGNASDVHSSPYGVPQGSVLGPVAFTLYVAPLYNLIRKHLLDCVMYADDTQIYVMFSSNDKNEAMRKLQECMHDIKNWSVHNGLKLNESKTEIVHFCSKFRQSDYIDHVDIGGTVVKTNVLARDLGVKLDSNLTLSNHVSAVCKAAFFALHKIGSIRPFLSLKSTEKLVHAHVISRLDYCNGILFGLPDNQIQKLQRVQNAAARLVTRAKKHDHVSPILFQLHWLPIRYRIQFKILSLVFLCINDLAPSYLQELLVQYRPSRNLRSQSKSLLVSPRINTQFYGARSFQSSAPELWNNIPDKIKTSKTIDQFKAALKTHYFMLNN